MNDYLIPAEGSVGFHHNPRPSLAIRIDGVPRQEPVNPWAAFALVAVETFMTMLDASIVNISLPSIARTFDTQVGGTIEWVIIAYLVTIAATLLTFGRVGWEKAELASGKLLLD